MNTLELMAATVGLWKLKEKGVRDTAIGVRGDNMTAMEWAESKGFRSAHAQKTAIAFTALSVEAGLEVVQKTHLPHTKKYDNNWRTDKPSRHQMTWDEVRKEDARDRVTGRRLGEEMEEWDMTTAAYLCEMCDPMEERRTEEFVVKKVLEMTGWGEKRERKGKRGKGRSRGRDQHTTTKFNQSDHSTQEPREQAHRGEAEQKMTALECEVTNLQREMKRRENAQREPNGNGKTKGRRRRRSQRGKGKK